MNECLLVLVGEQRNTCWFAYWGGLGSGMELRRNVRLTTESLLMLTEVSQAVASNHNTMQGRVQGVPKDRAGWAGKWVEANGCNSLLTEAEGWEGSNPEWLGLG